MHETLFVLGVVFAVLAGGFLIASVTMFFSFNIPALRRDMSGVLEQKQIEEIRRNTEEERRRGKVNVFEDLEKKAKVKKNNTHSLNVETTANPKPAGGDVGTSVLRKAPKPVNPNFIIEKNIVFVSTNEVI